ncbi:MAG: CvpA family protein [Planctomycetaceae bacterium]
MDAMWYDAIIFALLVICVIRGAAKGFAWQIATIGALVLCFFFAETASLAIAPLIKLDPPLNRWVAMFALYIGASFVSFAAARTVRTALEKWQFDEYDKHLGAIFGFVKGVAIALVITFFAVTLSESIRAQVLASYSGYSAGHILSALHPVMPEELCGVIDPYLEKLGQTVVHDHGRGHDHDDGHDHAHDDFGNRPGDDFGNPPGSPVSVDPTDGVLGPPSDDFGTPPPDFGPLPDWQDRPRRQGTPQQPSPAPSVSDDLRRLVEDVPDDLKQAALNALKNTKPEHREQLLAQFQTAIPGLIKAVSMEWANGKPADADAISRREGTLREIAAIYNPKDLDAQQHIVRQAEQQLQGVPDAVADVVVQDWYADLLRLEAEDPDPSTSLATRLDVRIKRQLEAFGISLDRLSADLRARLGSSSR